jgi:hypothetical protein
MLVIASELSLDLDVEWQRSHVWRKSSRYHNYYMIHAVHIHMVTGSFESPAAQHDVDVAVMDAAADGVVVVVIVDAKVPPCT